MASRTAPSSRDRDSDRSLTARLCVEVSSEAACAILDSGPRGDDIHRNDVRPEGETTPGCRAEVKVSDDGEYRRRFVASTVTDYCVCPVFSETDCVVDIRSFRADCLFVAVTVPNRQILRDIIEGLRARGAVVTLESILPLKDRTDGTRTLELDADLVTEKQREAIEAAIESGYYDSPRRADLAELAEHIGVSQSAVSQRLNSAESTLVRALYRVDGNVP